MPLEAMTGFGSARKASPNGDISIDIKSLNNKYLDISIKTLQYSHELESLVKTSIKNLFVRGSFEVRIDVDFEDISDYSVNQRQLKKILTSIAGAGISIKELSLSDIARVPGILDSKLNKNKLINTLKPILKRALVDLLESRKKEGKKITKVFISKLNTLKAMTKKFEIFHRKATGFRERLLKAKHKNLGLKLSLEQFNQELDSLNIKHDFAEEIERINFHLDSLTKVLKEKSSQGKKIDFLLQELFREANTLLVKVDNPDLKNSAIDFKLIVEGLREQSQNLQ
ncbi:MAG: DUF1732 domain-containing protein [Gammaproteobacteria bacterium]